MDEFRRAYQIEIDTPDMWDTLEAVRKGRGMTRKGFIMHALANTYPELTSIIVPWLMRKPSTRKAVKEQLSDEE